MCITIFFTLVNKRILSLQFIINVQLLLFNQIKFTIFINIPTFYSPILNT